MGTHFVFPPDKVKLSWIQFLDNNLNFTRTQPKTGTRGVLSVNAVVELYILCQILWDSPLIERQRPLIKVGQLDCCCGNQNEESDGRQLELSLLTARPKENHRHLAAQVFGTPLLSFRVFLFSGGWFLLALPSITVLVCQGCQNEAPQTERLSQQKHCLVV